MTKQEAIRQLKKCKSFHNGSYGEALNIAIKVLEQRWIPVSERLPEEETDVLVCSETGEITVCCGSYSTEVSNTFIWYTEGWRYGKVTAWMPLPEPYRAESEEK